SCISLPYLFEYGTPVHTGRQVAAKMDLEDGSVETHLKPRGLRHAGGGIIEPVVELLAHRLEEAAEERVRHVKGAQNCCFLLQPDLAAQPNVVNQGGRGVRPRIRDHTLGSEPSDRSA